MCCILACRGNPVSAFASQRNYCRQAVLCCQQEAELCQRVLHNSGEENPDLLCVAAKSSLYLADPTNLYVLSLL